MQVGWTEKVGDREGTRIVLCNLADTYAVADLEVKGIECYRRALLLAEEAGDRDAQSTVLDELGALHLYLADDGPALAFTRRALMYEEDQKHDDVDRLRTHLDQLIRRLPES